MIQMGIVAPNLAALIGDTVGARLISKAGSLTSLAKCPASTVQILGAEKVRIVGTCDSRKRNETHSSSDLFAHDVHLNLLCNMSFREPKRFTVLLGAPRGDRVRPLLSVGRHRLCFCRFCSCSSVVDYIRAIHPRTAGFSPRPGFVLLRISPLYLREHPQAIFFARTAFPYVIGLHRDIKSP